MTEYANLIKFSNSTTYGNQWEAKLAKSVYDWVGEGIEIAKERFTYVATFEFNQFGMAVAVSVCIFDTENENKNIGCYSPQGKKLSEILSCYKPEKETPTSDVPSQPLNYYVEGYYEPGYYL